MPVFTFEKISPPTDGGPVPVTAKSNAKNNAKKQRGLIVQILDRFAEARVKKSLRVEHGEIARRKSKTSD